MIIYIGVVDNQVDRGGEPVVPGDSGAGTGDGGLGTGTGDRHDACSSWNMPSTIAYRKLGTWQVAMDFVERCCKATREFPRGRLLYALHDSLERKIQQEETTRR